MNSSHAAGSTAGPASGKEPVPGRRLFIAGSITLLVFSVVHMIPMFFDMFVEPTQPLQVEARRAMAAVVVDIGPFRTNLHKLHLLLSASYSTLLFFVAALNLVALPAMVAHRRLPTLAAVNAIFAGILLAIAVAFNFPPPAVFSLGAMLFFIAALVRAKR
jgi:hypothetical protein